MYRILEIEGEGNRDESDGRERYTFYTRKMEKHSRHPSLQGSIQGRRGKARDRDGSMNLEVYLYQRVERTERGKRSSILENKKPSKR